MAKATKILKISLVSIVIVGLIAYVVYAMLMMSKRNPEARCEGVELIVKKKSQAQFIDEKEVESMLRNAGLYPKDELMSKVDTKKIEDLISSNDFIEKVECYKTSNNKFCIKIEQRSPVMYVLPTGNDGYFVDGKGKKISKSTYSMNLLTATGYIDEKYACEELVELARFINADEFWNSQVEQIYVTINKSHKRVIEIIPRVGDHVIFLGEIDDFEGKFHRLKKFYQKALNSVGWNKYSRIDVQFDNQIICKKRKN